MKKIFCILCVLSILSPAFAEGEPSALDKTRVLPTVSYVEQGINSALSTYDSTNNPNGKFVESGNGAIVSSVTANNGTVTVTRAEVTIPVGGSTSSTHAAIWIQ